MKVSCEREEGARRGDDDVYITPKMLTCGFSIMEPSCVLRGWRSRHPPQQDEQGDQIQFNTR